ncbi:hypothetical protein EJ774_21045 [Pandoraea apista]|uniref:Calcium-binding protein n=1 Tax=Pandoraea apista TaxID=93218 RepID=A0ABX9ZLB6_9BURK|nr:hypothetical protein [Pandoraea apista]RSK77845.1 hypothetical protein EJE83_17810 [Pandoraea apista]RUN81833.1 hypothetical protein EJ774_21045 [Pandoraea apista]
MALIEVINDFGSVLLDDNFSSYAILTKGVATTSSLGVHDQFDYYAAGMTQGCGVVVSCPDLGAGECFIAFRSASNVAMKYQWRSGGNIYFFLSSNSPATVSYYIFAPAYLLGGNGILQLFNAAGQKTFDSGLQYSRVTDFVQVYSADPSVLPPPYMGNTGWAMPWATSRTFDSSRTYAVAQIEQQDFWDRDGSGSTQATISNRVVGCRMSGATAIFDYFVGRLGTDSSLGDYDAAGSLGATFMVIDVTGY